MLVPMKDSPQQSDAIARKENGEKLRLMIGMARILTLASLHADEARHERREELLETACIVIWSD